MAERRLIIPMYGAARHKCMVFFIKNVYLGDRGFAPEAKTMYDYDEVEDTAMMQEALTDFFNYSLHLAVIDRLTPDLDLDYVRETTDKIEAFLNNLIEEYSCDNSDVDGIDFPEHFREKFRKLIDLLGDADRIFSEVIDIITEEVRNFDLISVTGLDIDLSRRYITVDGEIH
ncbi:MAG: hypothetical protein ACRDDY_14015 [Clostridium sp.]|uniref:hypothetical protein n=1 Tax=Clostridium sp. TaxID=1506 RepID=UPI003EE7E3F3